MHPYTPGWLLPKLIELDQTYQNRYDPWKHTLTTGTLLPIRPIHFLSPGDREFEQTLRMIKRCLDCVDPYAHVGRTLTYVVEWMLFALGHPVQTEHPKSPFAGRNETTPNKLIKTLDLEQLIRFPADYWGHLLAIEKYGTEVNFYPTLPTVARTMATTAISATQASGKMGPYQGYDPCLGTGRLALELSNYCHSLLGWERMELLIKTAVLNFVLYAPTFAYPIPALGGDVVRGNSLDRTGSSVVRSNLEYFTTAQPLPSPSLTQTTPYAPTHATPQQLSLF